MRLEWLSVLFSNLISFFRAIIIGSFIFAFVNFTFFGGSFEIALINMVFSIGLLMFVKDHTRELVNSFVMLLKNGDDEID